ncbi:MAG TPA: GtrA family protein [Acidobacteriaceae bacterium]|nr:GtrA family protein [Acidobacteriaceae bacterium]
MNATEDVPSHTDGIPADPNAHGPFAALRRVLPSGEVIRFLMVGGFNTVFSIALAYIFILPVEFFFPKLPRAAVTTIANYAALPLSITVAFLAYKWIVFRTRGNYFKEWIKVFAVYGVSLPFPAVVIPVATSLFLHMHFAPRLVSLLALVTNSGVIACYSYLAHKKFSFKR